ncbi:MAG: hypothetical protein A3B96_00490 [Candidatus Spechtbacteria bacterium RIFCSPHIGHO2_02_FULL_43_15b]|uniref:Nucleotidyl transferase domain-containing protein n=1 Tax=Candidatus Spechtbacteria bacterium RIFCSPHIGHO2_01_FULL_43_30 TaxID=1802158 RepID=A0A1G2H518_9BACT|nr:MAG: hypothetical protein A2827_03035 [Candidatus Spechtbacteria bacterium RIFCSPHIGHO2_01_FULL_43_30]OGZ59348.1 MAG: hypothetical protein A3B96_00490 [Candidatus Spechtbacteria bacterium RIFCSPHIGHO2_02_FULL_43_15b]
MKAIILAGGHGTRLPEAAKDKPKALVEVGGKPIIQHQIEHLMRHAFYDIRLALGYKAEQIVDWLGIFQKEHSAFDNGKLKTDYVIEPEKLDTGGAIKFAAKDLNEPFMVLNGDILSDINFSNFYKKFKKSPLENIIAVFHTKDASSYGIINKDKEKILEFLEKPGYSTPGHINAGFYILSPETIKNAEGKVFSIERDIFPKAARDGRVGFYLHRGFWTDAGTEERLEEVRKYFESLSGQKH